MIHGYKPSANFTSFTGDGVKIEGECRQCVHCMYTWEYRPGSGTVRGYCVKCDGFLCARQECFNEQLRLIELMKVHYNQTRSCVPFEEWNNRLREKLEHLLPLEPGLTVSPGGIIIPRTNK